jgi:hypothetical protein
LLCWCPFQTWRDGWGETDEAGAYQDGLPGYDNVGSLASHCGGFAGAIAILGPQVVRSAQTPAANRSILEVQVFEEFELELAGAGLSTDDRILVRRHYAASPYPAPGCDADASHCDCDAPFWTNATLDHDEDVMGALVSSPQPGAGSTGSAESSLRWAGISYVMNSRFVPGTSVPYLSWSVCWCPGGPGRREGCTAAEDFVTIAGHIRVSPLGGPDYLEDDSGGKLSPMADKDFTIVVKGTNMLAGDRLRLLGPCHVNSTGTSSWNATVGRYECAHECGRATTTNSEYLRGPLAAGGPGVLVDESTSRWEPLRVLRGGVYVACMCRGEGNDCVAGEQFEYFAGEFLVRGASGVGVRTIAASASTADPHAGDSICKDFDLRLTSAGVPSSPAGILEVFLNGAWSPLCGHWFWGNVQPGSGAEMACIKMGYTGVSPCSLAPPADGWPVGCRFQTLDSDAISVGVCSGGEVPGACSNRRRDLGLSGCNADHMWQNVHHMCSFAQGNCAAGNNGGFFVECTGPRDAAYIRMDSCGMSGIAPSGPLGPPGPSCPEACKTCSEGPNRATGDRPLVDGVCTLFCSQHGNCGVSKDHSNGGTDCSVCLNTPTPTPSPTPAPTNSDCESFCENEFRGRTEVMCAADGCTACPPCLD